MKLYTEEQVRQAFRNGFIYANLNEVNENQTINSFTPIELPSDEEIEQYIKSFPYTKHLDDGQYNDGVIVGAELAIQWMRDKIQGGNK